MAYQTRPKRWTRDLFAVVESSMLDTKSWMDQVLLKMNESKTEFFYFGGSRQLEKCRTNAITANGEGIKWSNVPRYLGA